MRRGCSGLVSSLRDKRSIYVPGLDCCVPAGASSGVAPRRAQRAELNAGEWGKSRISQVFATGLLRKSETVSG